MCGRFTITVSKEDLENYTKNQYDIDDIGYEYNVPNFNVAPGTDIISVIHDGKKHRIGLLKWGFVPPFTMKEQVGFINAKSETIFDKPSFKNAAMKQRCIILADGFYEWKTDDKQPYHIQTDSKMFAMAGIWNSYNDSKGKRVNTVAIVTTEANALMQSIHERMPVILTKESEKIWLNPYSTQDELKEVLTPFKSEMKMHPVSKKVNSAKVNEKELIDEIKINHGLFDH